MQVIPPDEINVSFDDIGALEPVKNTLHEVRLVRVPARAGLHAWNVHVRVLVKGRRARV